MKKVIEIVAYNNGWPELFLQAAAGLRTIPANLLQSIHHIGSTSVTGLAAKDVIDIQVTVPSFSAEIEHRLTALGYARLTNINSDHRPPGRQDLSDAELCKWFFQGTDPNVNLHVRKEGAFNQRYPLLCRDFLRANSDAAKAYELIKINLAARFPNDLEAYYDIKDPVFDLLMAGAELWAAQTGWQLPPSD